MQDVNIGLMTSCELSTHGKTLIGRTVIDQDDLEPFDADRLCLE